MSTHRAILTGLLVLLTAAACEKAPAPPAEAATAPVDSSAPAASATTPVASPSPSAEASAAVAAAPEETAAPAAPAIASAAPASTPVEAAAHHGASHPGKEHTAEAPAAPAPSSGTAGATPEDPCQTKKFHYAQVSSACHSGGRKAAKVVMKGVVGKAKAAGTDLKCTSCHEDLHDFQLKSNAVGDLKNWL